MANKETHQETDAKFIKSCMEKMDLDIATRFVFSAMSLSKIKIEDAFALACREMALREENKKQNIQPEDKNSELKASDKSMTETALSTKSILDLVEDILLTATKKKK